MKFNFKFLLAAAIVPASFVTFSSVTRIDNSYPTQTLARPYIVEVKSSTGEDIGQFRGISTETDPFSISAEIGATPYPEDKFLAFPDIRMGIGSQITIYRAPTYTIVDGRKESVVRSWKETVGELLAEKKIELGDDDKINFSADTNLELGMQIIIIRVAITNIHISESIDYKIIKKEDKTLDKGKIRIEQAGQTGSKILTYQVRREDGVEVSRILIDTEVTAQPVDEIRIIGTKPVITVACGSRADIRQWILETGIEYGVDPDSLCVRMMKESHGNAYIDGDYKGLFQYEESFWASTSLKAGFGGADWSDAKAQVFTTAWAWSHGLRSRWPSD